MTHSPYPVLLDACVLYPAWGLVYRNVAETGLTYDS